MPEFLSTNRLAFGISNCRDLANIRSSVATAQTLGIGSVFVAEDIGCRDTFQLVAALAAEFQNMRFTISVTNPYLRSPRVLAESAATLVDLLGVNLTLGLGSSSREIIEGQLGHRYGGPVTIMRQSIHALRTELADLGVSPKIMIAAMGPRMLRLAGEIGDSVMLNTGTTPNYIRWARARVGKGADATRRALCHIPIAVWIPVYVGNDLAELRPRAKRWAASMLSIPRQGELLLEHSGLDAGFLSSLRAVHSAYPHSGDQEAGAALVPDHVVDHLAVMGSPSAVADRLQAFVDAGADTLVIGLSGLTALLESDDGDAPT